MLQGHAFMEGRFSHCVIHTFSSYLWTWTLDKISLTPNNMIVLTFHPSLMHLYLYYFLYFIYIYISKVYRSLQIHFSFLMLIHAAEGNVSESQWNVKYFEQPFFSAFKSKPNIKHYKQTNKGFFNCTQMREQSKISLW